MNRLSAAMPQPLPKLLPQGLLPRPAAVVSYRSLLLRPCCGHPPSPCCAALPSTPRTLGSCAVPCRASTSSTPMSTGSISRLLHRPLRTCTAKRRTQGRGAFRQGQRGCGMRADAKTAGRAGGCPAACPAGFSSHRGVVRGVVRGGTRAQQVQISQHRRGGQGSGAREGGELLDHSAGGAAVAVRGSGLAAGGSGGRAGAGCGAAGLLLQHKVGHAPAALHLLRWRGGEAVRGGPCRSTNALTQQQRRAAAVAAPASQLTCMKRSCPVAAQHLPRTW